MIGHVGAAVTAALITLAGGCGTKADAPDPTPGNIVNGTHTKVIKMPDGFRNVVFTCDGQVGLYVTSRGNLQSDPQPSSVTAVVDHPACTGG